MRSIHRSIYSISILLLSFCLICSAEPVRPRTANITEDSKPVVTAPIPIQARAAGFEGAAVGPLAADSGWRAQPNCDLRVIDTHDKYPGFGLRALALSANCTELTFVPFTSATGENGLVEMKWDFVSTGGTASTLSMGVQNRPALASFRGSGFLLDVAGISGETKRFSFRQQTEIHHAALRMDNTQSPVRVSLYMDGSLVESHSETARLSELARSFRMRSSGDGSWILDNFQFSFQPILSTTINSYNVSPDNMNGWGAVQETASGQIQFVNGPATPPLGNGSAQFTVDNNTGGMILYNLSYGGRRLDKINTLRYSTYRTGSGVQAISFQFDADDDVTDSNNSWKGRLVYEPSYTELVTAGVWQTWTPMTGKWWGTRPPFNATCPQGTPCTWAALLAAYPKAGILLGWPIYLKAGSGWPPGDQYNVDKLDIGFSTDPASTEWNFEPVTQCTAACYVDGVNGNDSNGGTSPASAKKTIQAAINQVSAGGNVIIYPATYRENLHVTKAVDLGGTDKNTVIVEPAVSAPNPCALGSLCGCPTPPSSNVFLIEASNVTIHDLTIDGDNPLLTSAYNVGGANIDARNGIEENFCAGTFTNTVVHDTIVRNIYLRGIQTTDDPSMNIHHNTVSNIQGNASSIALFGYDSGGTFLDNTVSDANDAISANWSTGTQFVGNTVTSSSSGIHTDNSHGFGGGANDVISDNNVNTGDTNSYGIWAFVPYTDVTIRNNTVTNVDVGLGAFASAGGSIIFRDNTVAGNHTGESAGTYFSTTEFEFGESDAFVQMTGTSISNYETGVYLQSNSGHTLTTTANCNSISGNTPDGVVTVGSGGAFTLDFTHNWWGNATGPNHTTNPSGTGDLITGDVPFSPWSRDAFPACSLLAGIPTRLAFQVQPFSPSALLTPITPAVKVRAEDNSGNLGINFTGTVNMSFVLNPTAATLGGTLSQPASSGVATFSDLTVSLIGNGYMLGAMTPSGLTGAVSAPFNVVYPAPVLTLLSPDHRGVGGAAFSLVVTGSGFYNGISTVYWNGTSRTTTYDGPTQLTASIPATDLTSSGTATVTVVNSAPGGGVSNPLTFTILTLPPEVWVNDDWVGTPTGSDPDGAGPATEFGYDAFATVQTGVNGVADGGLVHLLNGTYTEQVDIGRAMTVRGESQAGSIIRSPLSLATKFGTSNKPIVYAHGSESITIDTLTIDGAGRANGNYRVFGIGFDNAGGRVHNCNIHDVRETPIVGASNGVGIYALASDNLTHTLLIDGNVITAYEKNGMALNGAGLNATVTGNTVTGAGAISALAQNGIQIGFGGVGSITNNVVSGNLCSGNISCDKDPVSDLTADGAAGILLYGPGTASITVSGNTLSGNQFSVWTVAATTLVISGNAMTGPGSAGIAIWDCDQWCDDFGITPAGTAGTIQTNSIGGYNYGLLVRNYPPASPEPSVSATNNRFLGNPQFGAWSNTTASLTATCNYWNSSSGPTHASNPGGAGDAASDHLTFSPWNVNNDTLCSSPAAIPTRLVFVVQPSNTAASSAISPAVQVRAEDGSGNLGINFNGTVTMTLSGGTVGAVLTGGSAIASNGVATFNNLKVDLAGTNYALTAASAPLTSAVSNNFDIRSIPTIVYVNKSWTGLAAETIVFTDGANHIIGYDAFAGIQQGLNAVAAAGTVYVYPFASGYSENLIIAKAVTLGKAPDAAPSDVIVYPASSGTACDEGSICPESSNVVLVRSSDVTISHLTVDGDNPLLTSGVVRGGADLDARNGIITDHTLLTVYNNLTVDHCVVRNIYLRAVYASTGGTFNFHDNNVTNVQGDDGSIAIFNFGGAGTFANNVVSQSNDGVVANHSRGTQFLDNQVTCDVLTDGAGGLHTDNTGDGGGSADLLDGNQVTDCYYGMFVFVPYKAPTVSNNTIDNAAVGLAAFGGPFSGPAITPLFSANVVNGRGTGVAGDNSGFLISSTTFRFGETSVRADLQGNQIQNFRDGIRVEPLTKVVTLTGSDNVITLNGTGVVMAAGASSVTLNQNSIFANATAGFSNLSSSVASATCVWWGIETGPFHATLNPLTTGNSVSDNVTFSPWSITDAPYDCSGANPGAPVITSITDNNSCVQDGIHIAYTPGSGAIRHDLYRDGVRVVTNYASGALYNPGNTASHSYVVRAVEPPFATDSAASAFADANDTPLAPSDVAVVDAGCNQGVLITFTPTNATSYDLYVGGSLAVSNFVSGSTWTTTDTLPHNYMIRARRNACSADSAVVNYADSNVTPPSVGTLYMQTRGSDLLIYWTSFLDPSVVDYYEVVRSLDAEGPFDTTIGTASGNLDGLQVDLNLEPPIAFYKVRAVKGTCRGPM